MQLYLKLSVKDQKRVCFSGCRGLFNFSRHFYLRCYAELNQVDKVMQNAQGMEVSLIQGNIDQSIKWNENFQKETLNIYERLSLKNTPAKGGLIVWPETAAPI